MLTSTQKLDVFSFHNHMPLGGVAHQAYMLVNISLNTDIKSYLGIFSILPNIWAFSQSIICEPTIIYESARAPQTTLVDKLTTTNGFVGLSVCKRKVNYTYLISSSPKSHNSRKISLSNIYAS